MPKCIVGPDHPVRSIKGGFAAFLLMSRPPLLYQEGSLLAAQRFVKECYWKFEIRNWKSDFQSRISNLDLPIRGNYVFRTRFTSSMNFSVSRRM